MAPADRTQLHLVLPFNHEPREHPRVAAMLAQGFRIQDLQRLTDREVLITLARRAPAAGTTGP